MRFGVREIVLLVALMALPLSSYWLVFAPQNRDIAAAKAELDEKRILLDKLAAATQHNESIEAANQEIIEAIGSIESRLPSDKEIAGVVRQVSDLAVRAGLEQPAMTAGDPSPAPGGGGYLQQPINLALEGDFVGFYKFLLELEKLPRITRVPSMDIKRSRKTDGHMEADMTLTIYFEKGD